MADEKEIKVSGAPLKALVRAAEAPVVGHGVKNQLLSQMGLDALFELDLRAMGDPAPYGTPLPPVNDD
ncbi:hypothetical protein FIV42_11940 [Persicimonas caeni]|jgi:hypothetical protein|uniref:Uncharacterized protein n=1 Tax=Persicimonas caeni TaxID=2292766 RepID=A0A4Y6PTS8_PERCE|nr:hypothetical protein [Persicimonas caeni]QDG51427.1 hypothetical protein FIV42_11940 [Persicimonas caeni]QED32648.1 hypothetical protein FRD00_11935 [Persicimonas caeni]